MCSSDLAASFDLEKTELYTRSNEAADIVTKEMYTFEDKGDRKSVV